MVKVITLNFWCLNPGVAFDDLKQETRSIVLTSGTLSPMATFASELDVKFPISLEANHVIDKNQVWVGTLANGPTNYSLNATYRNAQTMNFRDEVGRMLLGVCSSIPHGVLIFLPSYNMLNTLTERWRQTGLWDQLTRLKAVITEPKGNDRLDEAMKEFYSIIGETSRSGLTAQGQTGALFMAVCRGKVSEGMDFADNNARAVICVGIPFPNVKDTLVDLKKQYNDSRRSNKTANVLSGSEWYEIQAFRALNQALGRCIRHRNDWGAIIMVDDRYANYPRYVGSLSKWVRGRVVHWARCQPMLDSLSTFAKDMKLFDEERLTTEAAIKASEKEAKEAEEEEARAKKAKEREEKKAKAKSRVWDNYMEEEPMKRKSDYFSEWSREAKVKRIVREDNMEEEQMRRYSEMESRRSSEAASTAWSPRKNAAKPSLADKLAAKVGKTGPTRIVATLTKSPNPTNPLLDNKTHLQVNLNTNLNTAPSMKILPPKASKKPKKMVIISSDDDEEVVKSSSSKTEVVQQAEITSGGTRDIRETQPEQTVVKGFVSKASPNVSAKTISKLARFAFEPKVPVEATSAKRKMPSSDFVDITEESDIQPKQKRKALEEESLISRPSPSKANRTDDISMESKEIMKSTSQECNFDLSDDFDVEDECVYNKSNNPEHSGHNRGLHSETSKQNVVNIIETKKNQMKNISPKGSSSRQSLEVKRSDLKLVNDSFAGRSYVVSSEDEELLDKESSADKALLDLLKKRRSESGAVDDSVDLGYGTKFKNIGPELEKPKEKTLIEEPMIQASFDVEFDDDFDDELKAVVDDVDETVPEVAEDPKSNEETPEDVQLCSRFDLEIDDIGFEDDFEVEESNSTNALEETKFVLKEISNTNPKIKPTELSNTRPTIKPLFKGTNCKADGSCEGKKSAEATPGHNGWHSGTDEVLLPEQSKPSLSSADDIEEPDELAANLKTRRKKKRRSSVKRNAVLTSFCDSDEDFVS